MCLKDWTVAWQCNTKNASSPHRKRHHARASFGASPGEPHTHPSSHQSTNGLGTKWVAKLATLDANYDAEQPVTTSGRNGTGRVRKAVNPRRRKPTPLQTARWKAVQRAKRNAMDHPKFSSVRGTSSGLVDLTLL